MKHADVIFVGVVMFIALIVHGWILWKLSIDPTF
jgi:hypothetical protein